MLGGRLKAAFRTGIGEGLMLGESRYSLGSFDVVVDVKIVLAGMVPGIIAAHPIEHEFAEMVWVKVVHADGAFEGGFEALPIIVIEDVAVAFAVGFVGVIGVEDSVGEAAGIADDGESAVFEADELGEAAGFVIGGDEDEVGAGVDEVGELLVVADFEVAIRVIVEAGFKVPENGIDIALEGGAEEDELAAAVEAIGDGMEDEADAFLGVEAADESDEGFEAAPEPEAIAEGFFIGVFGAERGGAVAGGDMGIELGVPGGVIDAIEDAAEALVMDAEDALEAEAEVGVADFLGVAGGDGGGEIGIDDAAFHEVDGAGVVVIEEAVAGHEGGGVEADLAEDEIAGDALVSDVMESKADARVAHAEVLIDFVEEDGDESGLPIVAMDDVGVFIGLEHELEGGAGEEGEAFGVIGVAVEDAAVEEIAVEMGFDEEAAQAVHPAGEDIAMDPEVMEGDVEIGIGFVETVDAVVAHAVVFGEDDFDGMGAESEFFGEAVDDVGEAADFGGGSALGGDHDDEHGGDNIAQRAGLSGVIVEKVGGCAVAGD
jgi:hypothetical protein